MPGGDFMPISGQVTGSARIGPMTGRVAWRYGWPSSYGLMIIPSVPYIPITIAPYAMYPRTVWGLRRGRGRSRGRERDFRFWY